MLRVEKESPDVILSLIFLLHSKTPGLAKGRAFLSLISK